MEPGDDRRLLVDPRDLAVSFKKRCSAALRERWRRACIEARVEYQFATTADRPAEVLRAFLFARQRGGGSGALPRAGAAAGPARCGLAGADPPHRPAARAPGSVRCDGAVDASRPGGRRPRSCVTGCCCSRAPGWRWRCRWRSRARSRLVRSDLPAVTGRSQSAVIVLDDSASMRRRGAAGGTPFALRAGSGAGASSSTCPPIRRWRSCWRPEGTAAPIAELSGDRPRVLAALEAVPNSARAADFGAALRRAARILPGSAARRTPNLRRHRPAGGGLERRHPGGAGRASPQIVVMDASDGAGWSNRAVLDGPRGARARGGGAGAGRHRGDRQLFGAAGAPRWA